MIDDESSPPDEELEVLYEAFAPFNVDADDEGEGNVVHVRTPTPPSRSSPRPPPRTASTAHDVASCEWGGVALRAGMTVELHPGTSGNPTDDWGDFLTITKILRYPPSTRTAPEIVLEGLQTRRGKHVPMFNNKLNEVSLLLDVCADDTRDCFEQGTIRIFLEDVKQVREMVYTSTVYPEKSYLTVACPKMSRRRKQNQLHLTCRWIFIITYPDLRSKRSKSKAFHGEVRRFDANEITLNGRSVSQPATFARDSRPRFTFQAATYFSGFCGAGGDSEGARQAGATLIAGADDNESALLTFAINHPNATPLQKNMTNPMSRTQRFTGILILHLSPPCQYFSPAHTHEGKDDDRNSAALLCVGSKLRELKPIYLTLENTSGLPSHHPEWFAQLINQIINEGYNVRWMNNCQMMNYGLPTSRKRLILFAARDGYPLPEFPKPTHGPGFLPYNTVGQAIAHIPANDPLHLPTTKRLIPPKEPYSPDSQLNCVTTAGDIPHPSGLRTLSLRELSMLVGFPVDYQFMGNNDGEIRRQIGNVVPPLVWKHFIQAVIKSHRDFETRINAQSDDDIIEVIDGPTVARSNASRSSGSSSASTPQHRVRTRSQSPSSRPSSSRSRGSRRERFDDTPIPIRRMVDLTIGDRSPRRYAFGRSRSGDSEMIDLDD